MLPLALPPGSSAPLATLPGDSPALPVAPSGQPPADSPKYDRTHLNLTPEQQDRLREYVRTRIVELRKDMGLDFSATRPAALSLSAIGLGSSRYSSGFGTMPDSWAWKREANQKLYDGDVGWRPAFHGPMSIFHQSNYTLNTPKRWVRLLAARLNEVQLLTDPFFAVMPQPARTVSANTTPTPPDPANMAQAMAGPAPVPAPAPSAQAQVNPRAALAKDVESYAQGIIGESNLRETMMEARRAALIRNEAVVKLTWKKTGSTFWGPAKQVLVAPPFTVAGQLADGSPMIVLGMPMPDGSVVEPGDPVRLPSGDYVFKGDDVIPSFDVPGAEVLLKDPEFVMPPPQLRQFADFESLEQVEIEEGLDASTVFFKDFLFPIRCRSLKDADIMVHVCDMTLNELRTMFGGFQSFEDYSSAYATSEGSRARPEQGEQENGSVRELIGYHEAYVLFDADQDGKDEWIFCPYDFAGDRLIFFDYLKNHMPRPPFVMIPGVEKVESRAYGTGIYEMAKDKNLFIDLMFNRVNFMASKNGSASFVVENAIVECKDGGLKFVLGTDEFYTVAADSGYGPEKPPVFRVNMAEVPKEALELMEIMQQAGQLEFGIITPGDGAQSDMDASKTATGNTLLQQSGNSLQNDTADVHARAFTDLLKMAVETILENMPPNVAWFLEDGQTLATLNREEIRNLDKDVRLLLTKARSAQSLQTNAQATQLVLSYLQLPKASQKVVRPFFINQLRALDVQDADDHLPEPTDADIQAEAAAAGQGQEKPPGATVAAKLGDFIGSERSQIVTKFYEINPASPQEVQQAAAASAQAQETPAPPHHLHALPPATPPPATAA